MTFLTVGTNLSLSQILGRCTSSFVKPLNMLTTQIATQAATHQSSNKIILSTPRAMEVIDLATITHLEAFDSSTRVFFTNRPSMLSLLPLRSLVAKLDKQSFFQCHKSYAINFKHLLRYVKNGDLVITGDISIPLARRRKGSFVTQLQDYYEC